MANLLRLICLLLLACSNAYAALPQSTQYSHSYSGGPYYSTAQAACVAWIPNLPAGYNYAFDRFNSGTCHYKGNRGESVYETTKFIFDSLQCPANSTLSGSSCICNSGYLEQGGQCISKQDPDVRCAGDFVLSGFGVGSGKLVDTQIMKGEIPSGEMCWPHDTPGSGCAVNFVQDKVVGLPDGSKQTYGRIGMYSGPAGTTQGKACEIADPGHEVSADCKTTGMIGNASGGRAVCADPPKCPGGFGGEVNGVEVCVKDDGANVVKSEKKTEIKKPDGSTETVTEKTSCQGKTCTTEKTSTNTPAGGGSSTTNVTNVSQSKDDYCKNNADSAQCKGNGKGDGGGSFGGTCDAGFTCEGDALQCAVAREQYKRSCQMFETPSTESKLYDSAVAKGRDANVTANLPGNKSFDVSSGIQSSDLLGGARCVPNLNITVWGRSVSLPLSDICPALGYMGWVLVAVSGLVAFRIVSGTSKDD